MGFGEVLLGFTGFPTFLRGIDGLNSVLLWFGVVLPGFTGFPMFLLGLDGLS